MDGSTPQSHRTSAAPPLDSLVSFVVELLENLERQGALTSPALSASPVDDRRRVVERALAVAAREPDDRSDTHESRPAADATPAASLGQAASVKERPQGAAADARRRLFEALVGDTVVAPAELHQLAASIGWSSLPKRVQPVALTPDASTAHLPSCSYILAGSGSREPCFLVLDPSRHKGFSLRALLGEQTAAVGLTVEPERTGLSLHWARGLVHLHRVQHGQRAGLVHVRDHLSTLMLMQDEYLAEAHAEQWLRPLNGLTQRQTERVGETLLAWLDGRCASEAAKILGVHPQTIRYRLRQIEKLFGPTLYDPRGRFELKLALHSRTMLAGLRTDRPPVVEPRVRDLTSPRALRSNGLL